VSDPKSFQGIRTCSARGPLLPRQVWWGSNFTPPGQPKNNEVFVCLFVGHAFERQSLYTQFHQYINHSDTVG